LTPAIDVVRIGPPGVQIIDIILELNARELEQVKQEQRRIRMCERGMIGHGTGARHPWVELAEK
jgi:hypothetical protein